MLTRFSACVQSGDNSVDSVDLRGLYRFQHPQRTEARSTATAQLVGGEPGQLVQRLADRILEQHGRGVGIGVRAIGWLGDDRVDDPEPADGAHTDADAAGVLLKDSIGESLDELAGLPGDELRRRRRARFRSLGVLETVKAP